MPYLGYLVTIKTTYWKLLSSQILVSNQRKKVCQIGKLEIPNFTLETSNKPQSYTLWQCLQHQNQQRHSGEIWLFFLKKNKGERFKEYVTKKFIGMKKDKELPSNLFLLGHFLWFKEQELWLIWGPCYWYIHILFSKLFQLPVKKSMYSSNRDFFFEFTRRIYSNCEK